MTAYRDVFKAFLNSCLSWSQYYQRHDLFKVLEIENRKAILQDLTITIWRKKIKRMVISIKVKSWIIKNVSTWSIKNFQLYLDLKNVSQKNIVLYLEHSKLQHKIQDLKVVPYEHWTELYSFLCTWNIGLWIKFEGGNRKRY